MNARFEAPRLGDLLRQTNVWQGGGRLVGQRASSLCPATHTLGMAFAYSQVVYPNAVIDVRFAVSFGLPFFLLLSYLEPFNEQ